MDAYCMATVGNAFLQLPSFVKQLKAAEQLMWIITGCKSNYNFPHNNSLAEIYS